MYHLGLYNRPEVAAVPGDVSPTPPIIKIIIIHVEHEYKDKNGIRKY
jgi:hypothetical protein